MKLSNVTPVAYASAILITWAGCIGGNRRRLKIELSVWSMIGYRIRDTRVRETGTDRIRLSAASRYQGEHEFIREEEAESFAEHIREELDHHDKE